MERLESSSSLAGLALESCEPRLFVSDPREQLVLHRVTMTPGGDLVASLAASTRVDRVLKSHYIEQALMTRFRGTFARIADPVVSSLSCRP